MTFGHEICGIVEEVGAGVENLKAGDHVLVPFNIACGQCRFCQQGLFGKTRGFGWLQSFRPKCSCSLSPGVMR